MKISSYAVNTAYTLAALFNRIDQTWPKSERDIVQLISRQLLTSKQKFCG